MAKVLRLTESDLIRLVKKVINESESYAQVEILDDWIESNIDYVSPNSLEEKVIELFYLKPGNVSTYESVEKDKGGREYGENWNRILVTITNKRDVLLKVWLTSDYRYSPGKNFTEFGERFYFNEYAV